MRGITKFFSHRGRTAKSKPAAVDAIVKYEPAPWVNGHAVFRVDEKHPDGGEFVR